MADSTQVNYDLLASYEKRFQTASTETTQQLRQLRQRVEDLHGGGWIGQAADKFHNEMTGEVLPAVQRLAEAFNQAAEILKKVREAFNSAEEETKGYFNVLGE